MQNQRIKVIDCFPFYDEFLLLDIRFREYGDLVDKFVIIESPETYTGKPKPLYLTECLHERFPDYADKIIIIRPDRKEFENPWYREFYQTNYISKGNINLLIPGLSDNDLIIVGDADEIPRRETLKIILDNFTGLSGSFEFSHYTYKLNIKLPSNWYHARFVTFKEFECYTSTRFSNNKKAGPVVFYDAGWHFSNLKTPEKIKEKNEAFSHQEINTDELNNVENIKRCIENLTDITESNSFHIVPVDDRYPEYVKENRDALQEWIAPFENLKDSD